MLEKKRASAQGLAEAPPHYYGHRERLRGRFREAGADALSDYELLELLLFRALPRRDVKPLAKLLLEKFGSFAEVITAPESRLGEVKGLGDGGVTELKIVQAAAGRLLRGQVKKRPALSSWSAVLDYCRTAQAFADRELFRVLFLDKRNQLIADEVRQEVALENSEAQAAAAPNGEPNAASSSIARLLTDGKPHVFVAGQDLDVVDAGGTECALSQGDAIQLAGQTAPDAQAATLTVLASKGGKECPRGDTVSVALTDLQDMQNHMRESIDQGMKELQAKQGQGGLPAAPASAKAAPVESPMAAIAPPPPPESEVAAQIKEQSQEADKAEAEAGGGTASGPGPNAAAPAAEPANIEVGMTVDQVTGALGQPLHMATVGTKKIYSYKDMKITFKDGKVSDIQ